MKRTRFNALTRLAFIATSVAIPFAASAQSFTEKLRAGMGGAAKQAGLDQSPSLIQIIGNIINVALSFVGVVMLLYFLYAGFLYMTSAGDKGKIESARKIMINTIIGLVIIVASYAITNFVLEQLMTGVVQTAG